MLDKRSHHHSKWQSILCVTNEMEYTANRVGGKNAAYRENLDMSFLWHDWRY